MKPINILFKVTFLVTLFFLVSSCQKDEEKGAESKNDLFNWAEGKDSTINTYSFLDEKLFKIVLNEEDIFKEFNLSDIMSNYRLLNLENKESVLLGDIDKIIFSDSLIFVLDLYLNNSIQIFDFQTGEELMVFIPTGEGPGEIKSISDFDVDFHNKRIFVHDESSAKLLEFDFGGGFFSENKLPLRAHSFKITSTRDILFSSVNNLNDHLPIAALNDLIELDSNFQIVSGFKYPILEKRKSSFLPRDLMRANEGRITYFHRYSSEILGVDIFKREISRILSVDLQEFGLSKNDLNSVDEEFVNKRKADRKFFGFGHHFVSDSWIGMKFDRFGGQELQLFYNTNEDKFVSGTKINFDFEDLISFSFPLACSSNTCISVLKMQNFKNLNLEEFFSALRKDKRDFSKIEKFIRSVEDFDQPVLLIFDLKEP